MRLASPWLPVLASTLALLGCGGGDDAGPPGPSGLSALLSFAAVAPGEQCPAGGLLISAGPDVDRDGTLADSEVSSTQYLCHGTPGTPGTPGEPATDGSNGLNALVRMVDEPPGANCTVGGKAVLAGLDADGNGTLDPAEVMSTGYVCNAIDGIDGVDGVNGIDGTNGTDGTPGQATLVLPLGLLPGDASCPYGGVQYQIGVDTNGDRWLTPDEFASTAYQCNGAPGDSLTWIEVTAATVQAAPNTGYLAHNDVTRVVVTLPPSDALAIGDIVRVTGIGAAGWRIAQNAGQRVRFGGEDQQTTTGTSGAVTGAAGDAVELQYLGNDDFIVLSHSGAIALH